MASETHTISRQPGAIEKLMVQEHTSYPVLYSPTLSMSAGLNDNIAQW